MQMLIASLAPKKKKNELLEERAGALETHGRRLVQYPFKWTSDSQLSAIAMSQKEKGKIGGENDIKIGFSTTFGLSNLLIIRCHTPLYRGMAHNGPAPSGNT